MPRSSRIKNLNGIYHIMIRSISDIPLFRNSQDKDAYLKYVKKYQQVYLFKIYSYCLMSTHAHFIVDCNGADISSIMKSINQSYSTFFNKKYSRHGHVFQDRFKSKLITDEKYLVKLSLYIHNNPMDIEKFKHKVEKYRYSSLGLYLGTRTDSIGIVETKFILQMFNNNEAQAIKLYTEIINRYLEYAVDNDLKVLDDGSEYRSERNILVRDFKISDIIHFIGEYSQESLNEYVKYNHVNTELKSICVVVLRSLCNYKLKDLCNIFGNITASNVGYLCKKGLNLITTDEKYKSIIGKLISEYSKAS